MRPAAGADGGRDVFAWLGIAAIGVSIVLFGARTVCPGYTELLPTLGAAAVLAGTGDVTGRGPARVLSLGPLVWIGGISYSLYLWHWPLLALQRTDFLLTGADSKLAARGS